MFRCLIIALAMIGCVLATVPTVAAQPAGPTEEPKHKWEDANVLLTGKITKVFDVSSKRDITGTTWRLIVEVSPEDVLRGSERILRGSAKVEKALYAEYSVAQEEQPIFPTPEKECLIALYAYSRKQWLITVEVATKANIELARTTNVLPPEPVTKPIKLFNGKDFANFYTWLGKPYQNPADKNAKPLGKNNDPSKVFTVVDGAIRVSGEVFGGFITDREFENYHLVTEFKWGKQTFPPRAKAAMDSGILLHCVGADGTAGGNWMEAIECQMIEGGTGDFILVGGNSRPKLTATAKKKIDMQWYFYPKGETKEFTNGRVNWFGRDPDWKDVKGFRGKNDVEKAVGEWNTLECICAGDKITIILNGTTVNACTKASHTKGKILFQSEGAEVFFRRIELLPLKN